MKMIFLSSALALALLFLTPAPAAQEKARQTAEPQTKQSVQPGYAQVADEDKQMDRAAENAQKSLGFFMAALRAGKDGDTYFEIKKGFVDGDKVEQLWVGKVSYDGTKFHGQVDNKPLDVKNVHLGEHVTVQPQEVTDWMFLKDGKLMGGYTTRVLYARLSPEDKAQFEKEAGFEIK
jgi:uncharacterized protein YegJ (DUF2314 family)